MPEYDATKRSRYESLLVRLKSERASFDSHWRELGDYFCPRRPRFWTGDRNRGDQRNQHIIDSTGRYAARTLQSGLHSGLTSPARPWFKLTTPDPRLAEHGPVKAWLHDVTQVMATIFTASNLYNTLPIVYGDMGVFGTAAMAVVEDEKEVLRSYAFPIGSYVLGLDQRGQVKTFLREYQLTVRQVVEQFGLRANGRDIDWTNLSVMAKSLWDQGEYEAPIEVVWIVTPNDAGRGGFYAKDLPFASCHFERSEDAQGKFLRESGFRTFPILAPRWDITAEDTYGTDCPGMTGLGDTKMLQSMHRQKGRAVEKIINPPVTAPAALRSQKVSLVPGDVTYVDVREGMQGLRSIHEINLNLEHLRMDIGETQYRIQRAFYEDLFLMLARSDEAARGAQPVTAREIEERHEEKLLALGPVLERTNDELLDPLIDRTFDLMKHAGLLPEPPEELVGVELKVEYISILAQAQKLVGVAGLDRFLQSTVPLLAEFPEAKHKIDIFRVVDDYADMLGNDPRIVVDTDVAKQTATAQARQAQQLADAQQAMALAKAAKDAGATPMGGDTALSRVIGNAPAAPPVDAGAAA